MRRRQQQNKRDRAAREEYEATLPAHMVYHQPEPLKTNEHWDEEIAAGPVPRTSKRAVKTKDNACKRLRRGLESARSTPVDVPEILVDEADDSDDRQATQGSELDGPFQAMNGSKTASLRSRSPSRPTSRNNHRKWQHHKRWYQRPDEGLGDVQRADTQDSLSSTSQRTLSTTRTISTAKQDITPLPPQDGTASLLSRPPTAASAVSYQTTVHVGTVNNDHTPLAIPPTFLKGRSSQWMFQDLPAPSFMSGKDPEARTRSSTLSSRGSTSVLGGNSTGSLRRDAKDQDLRRQLSTRTLEDKLRTAAQLHGAGEVPPSTPRKSSKDVSVGITVPPRKTSYASEDGDADDEDENAIETDDEEIESRPSSRQRSATSSTGETTPAKASVEHIKPPPAAFNPSKSKPPSPSVQKSQTYPGEHENSRQTQKRSSRHRKRMTPDTNAFLFAYPVPLPEAYKADPDVARQARLSWERKMRGETDSEIAWRKPNWARNSDETDELDVHPGYDGADKGGLDGEAVAVKDFDGDRRWSADMVF